MAEKGVNKVILVGNCGNDPEMRYMPDGTAVATVSLATSETWKDKNTGQPQERTEWHRCTCFGKLAEIIGQYVHKGSKLYIEGKLRTRKWTDQQGVDRYTTEVAIEKMQMLDSRQDQPQQQANQQQAPQNRPQQSQQAAPTFDDFDDESIPF